MAATDWGTVPAWLALAGGAAALVSYRTSRRDLKRAPAAGVYVVVTSFHVSAPHEREDHTAYKVSNTGTLPIYDVCVSVWEFGKRRRTWRFRKANDWMIGARIEGRTHICIEPGSEAAGDDMSPPKLHAGVLKKFEAPPVMVVFRDGNGRRWVRWPDGRLNRVWLLRWA